MGVSPPPPFGVLELIHNLRDKRDRARGVVRTLYSERPLGVPELVDNLREAKRGRKKAPGGVLRE